MAASGCNPRPRRRYGGSGERLPQGEGTGTELCTSELGTRKFFASRGQGRGGLFGTQKGRCRRLLTRIACRGDGPANVRWRRSNRDREISKFSQNKPRSCDP